MKTFLLFCVVIASVTTENIRLSAEQREKVIQDGIDCMKETGASEDVLTDAKNGNYTENEDLKAFMFCIFQKNGVLSSSGELNLDVAIQNLPEGVDKNVAEKVLKECGSKTGKNARDTAYEILKCFLQGTKNRVLIE